MVPTGSVKTWISPAEIMADKLVALPANQKYVRHRDFWDLTWLHQQQTRPNVDLVRKKIADYRLDNFQSLLEARIGSVSEVVNSKAFHNEMKRFLPTNVYDRTLGQTKFNTYLTHTVLTLLETLHAQLYQPGLLQEPPFQL